MIKPQPGFQEKALSTNADIAIIGGSAGGGKTFMLELEPLRHYENGGFRGVIFRRTTNQIRNPGGLWETSQKLYPLIGAVSREQPLDWTFPSGMTMKFAHLEHEKNKFDWQGSEIAYIGFDELTHFSETQFWYLVSRNRSDCGVRPYIRATCNPDPDSWVAKMIEWYIDSVTGFPIQERAGVIRYFTRDGDNLVWGDSTEEVVAQCPHIFANENLIASGVDVKDLVKSFTFIPGTIYENKIFIAKDPNYLGNLLSMREEEKLQLLEGNWKIKLDGLELFGFQEGKDIFTNYPDAIPNPLRCITCDAARFGRDYCVVYVWKGWEVVYTVVWKKSDPNDVVKVIEELRRKYGIMRSDVLIDQDGVGGNVVTLGNYLGFRNNAAAIKEPEDRIKENYDNLKTQCYYHLSNRVNEGRIKVTITSDNCLIYDDSRLLPIRSTKIKNGSKVSDIRDLIVEDFRAIKRAKRDMEGKLKINSKEEQRNILGRSPDFADTMMMRVFLDLRWKRKSFRREN